MIRPLLSLKRLSFSEKEGQVKNQCAKEMPEKERMDYMEFIARVTSHIPDKGQVMVRYYRLYSNAHRGKKCKKESDTTHLPLISIWKSISLLASLRIFLPFIASFLAFSYI